MNKKKALQAIPAAIGLDISDAMSNLMTVIELIADKEERSETDQYILAMVIGAAKKLPIYREELQKYY